MSADPLGLRKGSGAMGMGGMSGSKGIAFGGWGVGRKSPPHRTARSCSSHNRADESQSSSGIISVMDGCGSSMSSGPHSATSLCNLASRLSLRQ